MIKDCRNYQPTSIQILFHFLPVADGVGVLVTNRTAVVNPCQRLVVVCGDRLGNLALEVCGHHFLSEGEVGDTIVIVPK